MLNPDQKQFISSFIDTCAIINLPSRKDRLDHILKELPKIGMDSSYKHRIIEGIRFPDLHYLSGRAGNSAAMCRALTFAYENNFNNFLLLEDDAVFLDERLPAIYDALKDAKNINWDIIFFGARIKSKMIDFSKGLYRIDKFGCNHSCLYNRKVIKYLLNLLPKWNAGYDMWMNWVIKNECFDIWQSKILGSNADFYCFSTKELVSLQLANFSDINQVFSSGIHILENDFNKNKPQ